MSITPVTSMQIKRRLPEGSVNKSFWLLEAMNEAYRRISKHGTAMRFLHIQYRLCRICFRKAFVCRTHLVKFIDIDKRKTIEVKFGIFLSGEINAVSIVGTLGRGHYAPAKVDLRVPCGPTSKGRNTVCILFIASFPMRNHIEEPTVEQIHPIRILIRDGGCQCTNTVFTIPCGKPVEEIFQRVEYRDAVE